jgi:hypothetical protein
MIKTLNLKNYFFALLLISINFLTSCVTLLTGATQTVKFESNPPGAEIYVNGVKTGQVTPAQVQVKKKSPPSQFNDKNQHNYVLKKEGYYDFEINQFSTLHPLAPFLWYSTVGISALVDIPVGSHRKYPENQNAMLIKDQVREIVKTEYVRDTVFLETNGGVRYVYEFKKLSDVDTNIPKTDKVYSNRYALIIGNEDYKTHQTDLSSDVNVDFARNDASAFKEYATDVLGIPERNITVLLDATSAKMKQALSKLNTLARVSDGNAELLFYYAGHGLPDEVTKEPYLIPVDVSGKNLESAVALNDVYDKLSEYPSKRVTVFMDACFSGGARNQGLIEARGVAIKPKEETVDGNVIAFSASSGEQSSLPLQDQYHGLFTYYLLKKLKETRGDISYKELADYVKQTVSLESVLVNEKEQTPQVNISPSVSGTWSTWKINE